MLLLSDPSIAAIPVRECGEGLVDLRTATDLAVDPRYRAADGAWSRLRSGLADRLVAAQASLPAGVDLLIIEGHRPAALQQRYFDEHCERLARDFPQLGAGEVRVQASRYIAPPEVAPHPSGAAVDLTLTHDGREVDMGTAVNDSPEDSDEACFTAAAAVTGRARAWRDLLADVLTSAGLVNYPTEWWHWSYGDRYWAATTSAPAAIYGPL